MPNQAIKTAAAPAAIGPYSQGVRAGGFLYLSGQLGLNPETGILETGIEAQTSRSLSNIKAILEATGMSMKDIVKTTVFVKNLSDFSVVNSVYASFFTESYPARSTIEAAALPKGGLVEIEAIAYRQESAKIIKL